MFHIVISMNIGLSQPLFGVVAMYRWFTNGWQVLRVMTHKCYIVRRAEGPQSKGRLTCIYPHAEQCKNTCTSPRQGLFLLQQIATSSWNSVSFFFCYTSTVQRSHIFWNFVIVTQEISFFFYILTVNLDTTKILLFTNWCTGELSLKKHY